MKAESISVSGMNSWNLCQLQYRFHYHDELEVVGPENPYAVFGSYIHKILERVIAEGKEVKAIAKEELPNFDFPVSMLSRVPPILSHWESFKAQLPSEATLSTEVEFDLPVDDIRIRGIIDLLLTTNNKQKALIIDYKTTQSNTKRKSEVIIDPQVLLYSYATHRLTGIPLVNIHAAIFYVQSGNIVTAEPNPIRVNNFLQSVVELVHQIRATPPEKAKAQPKTFCRYCDYCDICPYYEKWKKLTNQS